MTIFKSALALSLLSATTASIAAAPAVKSQAPGYYRMSLGAFEITALSDGTVALPVDQLLTNTTAEKTKKGLAKSYQKTPLETSVNGYLINTGSKLVLIDAGAGALFGPTLGRLVDNLKAAGYQPEQVDEVYITHMHPDHVGGLISNGNVVFKNATIRADQRDAAFWLSNENLEKAPADGKGFFQGAMASLNPYVAAGKFKAFDGATELQPGIRAVPTYGHTPGHTAYRIESQGNELVLWGDMMHVAAIQFPNPAVTIAFDVDSKAARPQREKNFADAAKKGYFVGLTHVSFPGIGQLRKDGSGYEWLPAQYQSDPLGANKAPSAK